MFLIRCKSFLPTTGIPLFIRCQLGLGDVISEQIGHQTRLCWKKDQGLRLREFSFAVCFRGHSMEKLRRWPGGGSPHPGKAPSCQLGPKAAAPWGRISADKTTSLRLGVAGCWQLSQPSPPPPVLSLTGETARNAPPTCRPAANESFPSNCLRNSTGTLEMRCLRFIKFSRLHLHKPLYRAAQHQPPSLPRASPATSG